MHELGHNLELSHSSEGSALYGDFSGIMGPSYIKSGGPFKCFNGVKTYQLGWFRNFHVELDGSNPITWEGDLVGFAEVSKASSNDKMIVRIQDPGSGTDYYVHFNRATLSNAETTEGKDQIMVASRMPGTTTKLVTDFSYLLSKLSSGDTYSVILSNGSGGELFIRVLSIEMSSTPARARVQIWLVSLLF